VVRGSRVLVERTTDRHQFGNYTPSDFGPQNGPRRTILDKLNDALSELDSDSDEEMADDQ